MKRQKLHVETPVDYAARRAKDDYLKELHDYRGGTIARMCLESKRYVARVFCELAGQQSGFAALERMYKTKTEGRTLLSITNMDKDLVKVVLCGKEVNVEPEHRNTVEYHSDLCAREQDALTVRDMPSKNEEPKFWVSERWHCAPAWLTLHFERDGYFSLSKATNNLLRAWPYTEEALEVFTSMVKERGLPFKTEAWPQIRSHPLYLARIKQLYPLWDSEAKRNVQSAAQITTLQDLHDFADLCESPEELLFHNILPYCNDKTLVEAWAAHFRRPLDIKQLFLKVKGYDGSHMKKFIDLGYLAAVPESDDNPFAYWHHYRKAWGIAP